MFKKIFVLLSLMVIVGAGYTFSASAQSVVNVRFRAGATSATFTGAIRGRRYIDYAVAASGGQTMSVRLTRRTGEDVYFNVLRKGSEVAIADDAREVTNWSGELDSRDTYVVRVYLPKAARLGNRASTYRLVIGVRGGSNTSARTRTVYYNCSNANLRADFTDGNPKTVRLRFGTQDINLPLEPSASGSKYEFNNQMFWVRGRTATLRSKVLDSRCTQKN